MREGERTKVEMRITEGRNYLRKSGSLGLTVDNTISWMSGNCASVAVTFDSQENADDAWQKINITLEANTEAEDYGRDSGVDIVLDRPEFINLPVISDKLSTSVFPISRRARAVQQLLKDEVRCKHW